MAGSLITGAQIKDNSVTGKDLKNNSVTGQDLKNGTVTGKDLKDGTVAGKDLKTDAVKGKHVADGSITGQDLKDGSITGQDLEDETVAQLQKVAGYTVMENSRFLGANASYFFQVSCLGQTQPLGVSTYWNYGDVPAPISTEIVGQTVIAEGSLPIDAFGTAHVQVVCGLAVS